MKNKRYVGIFLTCFRCNHEWLFQGTQGKNLHVVCPNQKCKKSLTWKKLKRLNKIGVEVVV